MVKRWLFNGAQDVMEVAGDGGAAAAVDPEVVKKWIC